MTYFEKMLIPLSQRLIGTHLGLGDLDSSTNIELLDRQECLHTGVLYIGTPKTVIGICNGTTKVEPACIILLAGCTKPVLSQTELVKQATVAELRLNLATLFNYVSRYLRFTFQEHRSNAVEHGFPDFWKSVMDQEVRSNVAVREGMLKLFPSLKAFMRVFLFQFDHLASPEQYTQLEEALSLWLPEFCVGRYEEYLVGFYSCQEHTLTIPIADEKMEELEQILEKHGANVAVSSGLRRFDHLRTNYILCLQILPFVHALHLPDTRRVHYYERYSMYHVGDLAAQRFIKLFGHSDIIYLINPAIVALARYDRNHNTNLRDTLFHYLVNDRNLQRTAQATFMHRNTVVNRIHKVIDLTSLDLSDGELCQRLIFSCQLVRYYEDILHLKLNL